QTSSTASPNIDAPENLTGDEANRNDAPSELKSPVVSGSPPLTGIPSLPTQGGDVPGLPLAGGLPDPPGLDNLDNSVKETMPPALPNQTQDLSVAGSPLADQRMSSPLATRLPSQVAPSVVVDSRQYSNVLSE